eukprot:m.202547 g.202547  ORF g.202547 m.202547 type:complete len:168 (+) comp18836_c0_seq1:369-872(+)
MFRKSAQMLSQRVATQPKRKLFIQATAGAWEPSVHVADFDPFEYDNTGCGAITTNTAIKLSRTMMGSRMSLNGGIIGSPMYKQDVDERTNGSLPQSWTHLHSSAVPASNLNSKSGSRHMYGIKESSGDEMNSWKQLRKSSASAQPVLAADMTADLYGEQFEEGCWVP